MTDREKELTRLVETLTARVEELQDNLRDANNNFNAFRWDIIHKLDSYTPLKYDSLAHYISLKQVKCGREVEK